MTTIEGLFKDMLANIELTSAQKDDAKTKYSGVVDCLSRHFNGRNRICHDQYLFGSYKTKTAIRPLESGSDVDVLFKISEEKYKQYENNPGGLLQEVRKALKDTYSTTDKISAWGKVVLVAFKDGTHNVEVLPALENEDGTFCIPNTSEGGYWEEDFDPRTQVDAFDESNGETCNLTRELTMLVKRWGRNITTLNYKSFRIVDDVIDFCSDVYPKGRGEVQYDEVMTQFITYIKSHQDKDHLKSISNHIETAHSRATKALQYRKEGKYINASEEWIKIFGDMFKKATEDEPQKNEARKFTAAASPWYN